MARSEIREHFKQLCVEANHTLTRSEYRKLNTNKAYSSSVIETLWGTWKAFIADVSCTINFNRFTIKSIVKKDIKDIVITSVIDGSDINFNCFNTLINYCKEEKCQLFILWGKAIKANAHFSRDEYSILKDYLVTDLTFQKDIKCKATDLLIPATSKNPLTNLDKLSKGLNTIIIGSPKQYLDSLPHDLNDTYKISAGTGTISEPCYKSNISGILDEQNHTLGGLRLEWDTDTKRYVIRQLQYKNDCIYDITGKCYTENKVIIKNDSVECMVLGDLHFPETDLNALNKTQKLINFLKPKEVMIHDWMSYQSINHHEENKVLTKLLNMTEETVDLKTELGISLKLFNEFANICPNSHFNIVYSNHDEFLMKWLNNGEFVKGNPVNRIIGCELFANIANGKDIFYNKFAKNVSMLPIGKSMKIHEFEVAKHGDAGIAGARGNINSYIKTYDKSITGHTHSPKIKESGIIVGTLSKLKLSYNKNSISNWAQANCIVYKNGSFQLLFV